MEITRGIAPPDLETQLKNLTAEERVRDVDNLIRNAANNLRATGEMPAFGAPSAKAGREGSEPLAADQLPFGGRPEVRDDRRVPQSEGRRW